MSDELTVMNLQEKAERLRDYLNRYEDSASEWMKAGINKTLGELEQVIEELASADLGEKNERS